MNRIKVIIGISLILLFTSCKKEERSEAIIASIPKAPPIAMEGTVTIKMLESQAISYTKEDLDTLIVLPQISQIQIDSTERYIYNFTIALDPKKVRAYGVADSVIEGAIRKSITPTKQSPNTIQFPKGVTEAVLEDRKIYIRGTYHSAIELKTFRSFDRSSEHYTDSTVAEILGHRVLPLPTNDHIQLKDIATISAYKNYSRQRGNHSALYTVSATYKGDDLFRDIQQLKKQLSKLSASYIISVTDKEGNIVSPYRHQ